MKTGDRKDNSAVRNHAFATIQNCAGSCKLDPLSVGHNTQLLSENFYTCVPLESSVVICELVTLEDSVASMQLFLKQARVSLNYRC